MQPVPDVAGRIRCGYIDSGRHNDLTLDAGCMRAESYRVRVMISVLCTSSVMLGNVGLYKMRSTSDDAEEYEE